MSNDDVFLTKSTVDAKDTIEHEGATYPLLNLKFQELLIHFILVKQNLLILLVELISSKIDMLNLKSNLLFINSSLNLSWLIRVGCLNPVYFI